MIQSLLEPERHRAPAGDPAIVARSLRVNRPDGAVLDGVSFEVRQGTVTGLLGPSGAGKTTLLRTIVGVQQVSAGTMTVLGHRAGSRQLRSRVGYATQEPAIYPDLTVTELLEYFAAVLGCDDGRVEEVIAAVGLDEHSRIRVDRLSGGQKARANLAVALLGSPDLLVLDEPTVGSDPRLRRELWNMFDRMAADGATVLVSSHMLDEAARCGELVLVQNGRVLAQDTPANLRARTGTGNVEEAFLSLTEGSS